jgi:hypothetical protein
VTPHQTLAVAVRLFALVMALYVGRELLGYYVAARDENDAHASPIVAAVSIVAILVLAVLWFFPRSIARGLLPLSSDTPAEPSAPDTWLAVGSSLIGLWLVASAVPALMRNALVMYFFRAEDSLDRSGLMSGLLYYLLQFAVGAALILGANGIRNLIAWARIAGTRPPHEER